MKLNGVPRVILRIFECLLFLDAKHLIATAATNGSIVLWNLNKPVGQRQDRIISEHSRAVNRLCFHPTDAIILLSASQDGTMRMWDLRTKNTAQYVFEGKSEAVRDVQFAPGNAYAFAAAFENGTFQKWDIRFPKLYEKKWNAHNALVLSLDWHQDGRYLATGGRDKQIKVWDTVSESRKPLVTIHNVSSVSKVAWQPTVYGNPIRIACSSLLSDNRIHVFDIERPSIPSYSFECHSNVVTGFQWKNSETIFSVSKDQKFAISSFPTTTESEGSGYRITDYISSSSVSFSPWDDIAVSSRILSERSQTPVEMLTHERTYSREKGIKPNILNEESLLRGSTVTLMTNNQFNLDSSR
jgi:WD40 repeat protein